jgi:hypothetical protein
VPVHPVAEVVIVMVAETGTVPVLVAAKAGISPVPLAASPMDVLLLVQLNVLPATGPVIAIAGTAIPLQ